MRSANTLLLYLAFLKNNYAKKIDFLSLLLLVTSKWVKIVTWRDTGGLLIFTVYSCSISELLPAWLYNLNFIKELGQKQKDINIYYWSYTNKVRHIFLTTIQVTKHSSFMVRNVFWHLMIFISIILDEFFIKKS